MINYDDPTLFLNDAIKKDFIITDGTVEAVGEHAWTISAGATVVFRNVNLESESFELHQSLNSEMQLKFGSCESAYISFICHSAWQGNIADLKGKVLNVYIIPNNEAYKLLQIGVFKVQENKLTNDRKGRKVVAYDAMYDILNADVTDWYNSAFPQILNLEPFTLMSIFRASLLDYFDIEAEETTLCNDSLVLHKTLDPETLSGADVIKAICEINGVFGMITNEGKFRFLELPADISNNANTTDIDVSYYSDVEYEEYESKAITGVLVITDTQRRYRAASASAVPNTYTINGNFLISDYRGQDLYDLTGRVLNKMANRYYQPLTVNALGNPVHEVGDPVNVILKDGTELPAYILERDLRGIQALRDTYVARGEEEASESLNSTSGRYTQISNEITQAVAEAASVASTTDFVEIIRNIGFRLLDEPSNVSLEYDDENKRTEINWEDPDDISTNEPAPCTWAGTVVVRNEDHPPLHRWDGKLVTDSTVRDQYASTPLVDTDLADGHSYYYGIFPYDTKGDYRYTKVVHSGQVMGSVFEWLYDASESEQFPYGLHYDTGTISYRHLTPASVESSYIDMPHDSYIIFMNKLKHCNTIKITLMRTEEEYGEESSVHLIGGTDITNYVPDPPNIGNTSGYNLFDYSPKQIEHRFFASDMPLNTQVTFSYTCPYPNDDFYIFLPASIGCRIYKIWGE